MSTKVGDIFVRANLDDKQYKKGLTGLGNTTSSVASKLTKALTLTAVVGSLTAVINKVSTLGDTIDKTSQKLGMSYKTYQDWSYIMARNGASIDSMTVAMKTLATSVETGKDALAELGITTQEAMGMSQEQLFERVVTALQGVEDVTHRTYLAGQLLGRGATELGAVLNLTAEDMDSLRNRLTQLGGVMSDTAVKNSAQFRDALIDVKMAFRGIGNIIAEYVLPVLTSAVNNVIIPAIQTVANALRSLFAMFGKIGGFISKGVSAVKSIANKASQKDISKTSNAISNVGSGLGKAGKNAGKAKKQVQALKKELLGFDKITKLTKQDANTGTGGGGGAGGGGLGGFDMGGADEANEATSLLSNITIPPALAQALEQLGKAFSDLFGTLKTFGKWALDNVLKPLGEWLLNSMLPAVIKALANAIDVVNNALKLLGVILKPLWKILKPIFQYMGKTAVEAVNRASVGLETLAKVLKGLKDACDKLKGKLEPIYSVWNSFKSKSVTAKISLSDKFSSVWNKVKSAWNGLKSKSATISLGFKETLKTKWNELARKVNNARAKAPQVIRNILPTMPYLAQGGYVKANTPQLAVIGDNKREGEIVAPESKLRAMAQEVANQNNNAEVVRLLSALLVAVQTKDNNVYLDGEQIKNNVVRRINNHTRATGQLELIV